MGLQGPHSSHGLDLLSNHFCSQHVKARFGSAFLQQSSVNSYHGRAVPSSLPWFHASGACAVVPSLGTRPTECFSCVQTEGSEVSLTKVLLGFRGASEEGGGCFRAKPLKVCSGMKGETSIPFPPRLSVHRCKAKQNSNNQL